MTDERFEEHVRASLSRLDLPDAPERLIERAGRIVLEEPPRRSLRFGLVLVLATILIVTVFGSLQLTTGGPLAPEVSPSPSASAGASPTAAAVATEAPETPSATPTLRPFPVERPYPSAPPVEPARDDDLALAGQGGVPGLLYCGFGLPFNVDAIKNPTGAEDRQGPEYEALQTLLDQYVVLGEFDPDPTAREVARDATGVMFLVDHQRPSPAGGFPFVPVSVDLVDGHWVGYEGVDCNPQAVLPPGYDAATWTIDPGYTAPTAKTRALHILVTEHACASGRSASGRIGPAYVVATRYEIRIGVMVQRLPREGDCQAVPATPARLSLPERIGDRILPDMYHYLNNQSGG